MKPGVGLDNLDRIAPVIILLVTAGVVVLADLIDRRERTGLLTAIALAGLALAAADSGWLIAREMEGAAFDGTIVLDQFTLFFNFFIGVTAFTLLASADYVGVRLPAAPVSSSPSPWRSPPVRC